MVQQCTNTFDNFIPKTKYGRDAGYPGRQLRMDKFWNRSAETARTTVLCQSESARPTSNSYNEQNKTRDKTKKFTTTRYQIRGGTTRTQTSRKSAIKSGGRSGQAVYPFYAVVVYKVSKDKLHRFWDGIKGNTRRRG